MVAGGGLTTAAPAQAGTTTLRPGQSISAAVSAATSGSVIELASGNYAGETIKPSSSAWSQNVVVRPASGASVTTGSLDVYAPGVTISGLNVTGMVYLRPSAHRSRVEDSRLRIGYTTGADNTAWVRNTFLQPPGEDGLQIKGLLGDNAVGVLIEGNRFPQTPRVGTSHTDNIQLLGAHDVIIRGNRVMGAASAAIQIGNGAGGTIGKVTIVNNFLGEYSAGGSYHAVIVGSGVAPNVTMLHNTIAGSVAVAGTGDPRGMKVYGNIADQLPTNVTRDWNLDASAKIGSRDVQGRANFVDRPSFDLRLTNNSAGVDAGSPWAPSIDINGATTGLPSNLGAWQGGTPAAPAPTTVSPSPSPTVTATPAPSPTTTAPIATPAPTTTSPAPVVSAAPVTTTWSGTMTNSQRRVERTFDVGSGTFDANVTLNVSGTSTGLTAALYDSSGTQVAKVNGTKTLTLSKSVPAGKYLLRIYSYGGAYTAAVTRAAR